MTRILVCETVQAPSLDALVRARDGAITADLVELRLDGLRDPDPAGALAGRRTPVVVTCRPRWEGGAFDGDETTRAGLLEVALRSGADFVDVEFNAPWRSEFVRRWRERIVLSWHDFSGTPADLADRARAMAGTGAAIVKLAVLTTRLRDLEPLLGLRRAVGADARLVAIGMGDAGVATRVLPHRFGSCWTYAGPGVAPGQLPAPRLVEEFRVRSTSPATAVFGVVGRPVGHSVSPAMHNAAFARTGVDAVYVPLEAADFGDFLWAAEALDLVGVSVTAPFKEEAFRCAGRADRLVEQVAAANTLRREPNGEWAARNTDLDGFLAPLAGWPIAGRHVAVLGAGGAARAVVAGLAARGALVTVHARRPEAAASLAALTGATAGPWPPRQGAWDLMVNTTPVGTWPAGSDLPIEASFVHAAIVYDLVYNPPETAFLRAAAANGCRAIGGLDMLVGQAARQFEWWTGHAAPVDVMRAAAERRLAEFRGQDPPTGER